MSGIESQMYVWKDLPGIRLLCVIATTTQRAVEIAVEEYRRTHFGQSFQPSSFVLEELHASLLKHSPRILWQGMVYVPGDSRA